MVPRDQRLLERAGELDRLAALLERARGGGGGLLIVEGEAGIGKTRLIAAARQLAADERMAVIAARGGELERDFAYGVARQLFEGHLRSLPQAERGQLLSGAAAAAAGVLGLGDSAGVPVGDASVVIEHGLYWLTADLGARAPLLLCVDDAHWSDLATLRWLVYLARRLEDQPIAVLVGWRVGEPGAPEELLEALRVADAEAITPGALSRAACVTFVRATLAGAADTGFCDACHDVSGGNPLLLGELVRALAAEHVAPTADSVARVTAVGPSGVARGVLVRLSRLPDEATRLARAVAVLDNDADLRRAAALAGLDDAAAVAVVSALAAAHILEPSGAPRFAHPILRTAVHDDLGLAERSALHRAAARLLEQEGHSDRAAVHLMSTQPGGEEWVCRLLREAGQRALRRGAVDSGLALLRRALEEPPPPAERSATLRELGVAARFAGDPDAVAHLQQSLALAHEPEERTLAAHELNLALVYAGRGREAVATLEGVIDELPEKERELRLRLEVDLATTAVAVDSAAGRFASRLENLSAGASGATPAERSLLAHHAVSCALRRDRRCEEVAGIARRAWADGQLLDDAREDQSPVYYALVALAFAEDLELARRIGDLAVAAAREQGTVTHLAGALATRSSAAFWQGDLRAQEADARAALHLASLSRLELLREYALGYLVFALSRRGDLQAAERALAEHGLLDRDPGETIQQTTLLAARGELWLASGRHGQAVRDLETAIARYAARSTISLSNIERPLALALQQAGDLERARDITQRRLAVARRWGSPADIALSLGTLGLLDGGAAGISRLEEAAALAAGTPRRLVEAQALLDLGAALRRANRRADAREPLRRALDLAHACGAWPLENDAHDELRACGARPRRPALSGADSLTVSEHRIAEMAAGGSTNREIAQALFVTTKTVESHMRAIFRKLDLSSRSEIAAALSEPASVEAEAPEPDALGYDEADETAILATILFTDIVGSTEKAAQLGAAQWRQLIDRHDAVVRAQLGRFGGREVKSVGDGFLATFDSPTRALRCAFAIRTQLTGLGLQLRAGLHTGELSLAGSDLRGIAVHVAGRIVAAAAPGEVLVSDAVRMLVSGSSVRFRDRGAHELKGVPGPLALHAAESI